MSAEYGVIVEINKLVAVKVGGNALARFKPVINADFEVIGIHHPVIGHIGDAAPIGR